MQGNTPLSPSTPSNYDYIVSQRLTYGRRLTTNALQTTFHNLVKQQNQYIQDQLRKHFTPQQLETGFSIALDGASGGTSRAYVEAGVPAANVVAVSNSSDASILQRSITLDCPLWGVSVLQRSLGSLLSAPDFKGPCVRCCYFDYMGSLDGRATGPKSLRYSPRADLRVFFERGLAMRDGCLIFITIGLRRFRKKSTLYADVAEAQALVPVVASENQYHSTLLCEEFYVSNRVPMCMLGFYITSDDKVPAPGQTEQLQTPAILPVPPPVAHRCGATTVKGKPCRKEVRVGQRCHHHRQDNH